MGLFHQFCRNLGLMVHNIKHPNGAVEKKVLSKTVEEKKIDATTTLRRTTIDEVEVRKSHH